MVSIQIPTVSPSNFYFRTWVHRTFVRETFCRTILTFVCRAFIFRTYLEISVSDQSNKQSNEDWESTNNLKNKTLILNTVTIQILDTKLPSYIYIFFYPSRLLFIFHGGVSLPYQRGLHRAIFDWLEYWHPKREDDFKFEKKN